MAILWSLPFALVQFVLDLFVGRLTSPTAPIDWTLVVAASSIQFVAGALFVRYMYRKRS